MRELSGLSRPTAPGGDKKEVDSATFVRENVLTAKTGAAEQMMEAVGGAVGGRTEQLMGRLVELQREAVTQSDLQLAGCAEATVTSLLKHLDTAGVDKASLEDVVTTELLLTVPAVAARFGPAEQKQFGSRVAQHKLQVLSPLFEL